MLTLLFLFFKQQVRLTKQTLVCPQYRHQHRYRHSGTKRNSVIPDSVIPDSVIPDSVIRYFHPAGVESSYDDDDDPPAAIETQTETATETKTETKTATETKTENACTSSLQSEEPA